MPPLRHQQGDRSLSLRQRAVATTGNVITQGIAVRLHWQDKFDWKAVATTAIVAPLSKAVTNGLGLTSNDANFKQSHYDRFGASLVSGLIGQSVRMAVYSKGKLDYASLAGDAFGNVLGDSVAEAMRERPVTQTAAKAADETHLNDGVYGHNGERVRRVLGVNSDSSDMFNLIGGEFGGSADSGGEATDTRALNRFFKKLSGWSKEEVSPSFDYLIMNAASEGNEALGILQTMAKIAVTGLSDAVSGMAGLGVLTTDQEARNEFVSKAKAFLEDPQGSVSRAFDEWNKKAWYDKAEDVFKFFEGAGTGVALGAKAKGLFSAGFLDDISSLGSDSQRVLREYQSAYDDAAKAFDRKLADGSIVKPDRLNFNTWKGNRIDQIARDEMKTFKQVNNFDDLRVNQHLDSNGGIKDYRVPDLFLPAERTVIDGTIGTKSLTTPQIQDFFNSGKVDRVILVTPYQKPIIITADQFRAGKG